jgi:hypothetical protein
MQRRTIMRMIFLEILMSHHPYHLYIRKEEFFLHKILKSQI